MLPPFGGVGEVVGEGTALVRVLQENIYICIYLYEREEEREKEREV